MTAEVEIVHELMAPIDASDGEMTQLLEQEELLEPLWRLVAPDAPIEFPVPGGGFVGDMAGPFHGPQGFLDAWREWLGAWEEFRIETEQVLPGRDGRVLLLATLSGRLRDSETSVSQEGGAVWTISGDRVTRIENFLDHDQARAAAGLS
jgi:hypothetical protein